jgi:hypothetical protein
MQPGSTDDFQAIQQRWEALALKAPVAKPDAPIAVLTGEATYLAALLAERWEPQGGDRGLPGMKQALTSGLFDENIAREIRELALVVSQAHNEVKAVRMKQPVAPVKRAKQILLELRRGLGFLFDDGVLDGKDGALSRLNESHNDTQTHHALAMSLEGFALFADSYRAELSELPGFDSNIFDDAWTAVGALRQHAALRVGRAPRIERGRRVAFRNRLIGLLAERVRSVRRAARFVFRHHPKIAQEFCSEYQRSKRARSRARSG